MFARLICFLFGHDAKPFGGFHMIAISYPVGHSLAGEKITLEICKRCAETSCTKSGAR